MDPYNHNNYPTHLWTDPSAESSSVSSTQDNPYKLSEKELLCLAIMQSNLTQAFPDTKAPVRFAQAFILKDSPPLLKHLEPESEFQSLLKLFEKEGNREFRIQYHDLIDNKIFYDVALHNKAVTGKELAETISLMLNRISKEV